MTPILPIGNILPQKNFKKHSDFFRPVKNATNLTSLEQELKLLAFTDFTEGLDAKGFPIFRLFRLGKKIGIIVVLNFSLRDSTLQLIERNKS